jgi:hypothetical protein
MGLNPFKSKKKTVVGTSISRVVQDELIPDPIQQALLASVIDGSRITDNIINSSLNNPIYRFERAYAYGKEGGYYYGLPDTTLHTTGEGVDTAKSIIEGDVGRAITLEYLEVSPLNNSHVGWEWCTDNGYNYATNEIEDLSASIGFPVYLEGIVQVRSLDVDEDGDPDAWVEWEDSSLYRSQRQLIGFGKNDIQYRTTQVLKDGLISGVEISYVWEDGTGTLQDATHIIQVDDTAPNDSYVQAKYSYQDGDDTIYRHWTYRQGTGIYPPLDALYETTYSNPGTYFPFLPFRQGFQNLAESTDTQLTSDLSKMAKKFNMNYDEVSEAIHENPDVNDVISATMVMAVPINSQDPIEQRYLFEYFDRLNQQRPNIEDIKGVTGNQGDEHDDYRNRALNAPRTLTRYMAPPRRYALRFQDAGQDMTLRLGAVTKNTIVRTGAVGTLSVEIVPITVDYQRRQRVGSPKDRKYETVWDTRSIKTVCLRKQITNNLAEEIIVVDPEMVYVVDDFDGVFRLNGFNVSETAGDRLLIPLDRDLVDKYPLNDKNVLYHRSMHFIFNSKATYKVEWYETGFFKVFVIAVAVVITIVSAGSGAGPGAALIAAVSAGATATLIFILQAVIISILAKYAFKLIAEEFGIEVAIVLAIVLTIASMGSDSSFIQLDPKATFADNLLALGNNLVLGVSASGLTTGVSTALEVGMRDLMTDVAAFEEEKEDMLAELERVQAMLENPDSLLDPLWFTHRMEPMLQLSETPSSFFARTVEVDNIGTTSFDFIENFVDVSLTLPDIDQTIGV